MVQKVAWARDGELRRRLQFELNGLALALRPQAQAPRLNVDATIPEAGVGCGDGDVHGARDVEVDEVVACGDVGYIDRLAVYGDGESRGAHLRWDRYWLNAGRGDGQVRIHKNIREQRAETKQEAKPRR